MAPNDQYLQKLEKNNPMLYKYFLRGLEILELLNSKMYEAYFIGGVVRDYLLGVEFKDIDIATSATPKEVLELLPKGDGRFSELGCVEIREGEMIFQITTFRDEKLVTTRKTKNIHYSKKLIDDVLRRDFSINALALSANLKVIDVINGKKDLKKGLINVIGKGKIRFKEDPLRMLRAIELISRYNLVLSSQTIRGIKKCRKYMADISDMKFTEMLLKIMSGKYARNALAIMANLDLFGFNGVYRKWLIGITKHYKKTTMMEKLALLYYMYGVIPQNSCYSHKQLKELEQLINMAKIVDKQPIDGMLLYKYGSNAIMSANLMLATIGGKYKNQAKLIKKLDAKLEVHHRSDFNFTAEELVELMGGKTGPKITEIMELLIGKVIRGEILNNNTIIRQEALRILAIESGENPKCNTEEIKQDEQPVENIIPEKVKDEETSEVDIESIKDDYANEFRALYATYMRQVRGYQDMKEEEKEDIARMTKARVRKELLLREPKYKILVERGII